MPIRKQVIWSETDGKYVGYCDFGGAIDTDSQVAAQLLSCCMKKLFDIGITVQSVTCDGTTTNKQCLKNMGCRYSDNVQ